MSNSHEIGRRPETGSSQAHPPLETAVQRWMRPLSRFLHVESASGVLLLAVAGVALGLANSKWSAPFANFWQTNIGVTIGAWGLHKPLVLWVNDGMMTLFFFVVGLEIKREIVAGELRDWKKASLPVLAALGGMIVPAAIYLMLRAGGDGQRGWGIPMATDIAFVVGFLALFGRRVPVGLKITLLSLAIADDIGAILVIAVFYSSKISLLALAAAAAGFLCIFVLRRLGVRAVAVYAVVGAAIWLAFLKSGIHPTIAGVLLGLLTPATAWISDASFLNVTDHLLHDLRNSRVSERDAVPVETVEHLEKAVRESISPLERLESALHPWVAFLVMPVFALANAGVSINMASVQHPVALAVALGLILGKPVGILLFSWLAVRFRLARLPGGVNWKVMLGAGCLAGIGFTMSLFVAGLALEAQQLDAGKFGTLAGSAISAVLGSLLLFIFLPKRAASVAAPSDPSQPPRHESLEVSHVD